MRNLVEQELSDIYVVFTMRLCVLELYETLTTFLSELQIKHRDLVNSLRHTIVIEIEVVLIFVAMVNL